MAVFVFGGSIGGIFVKGACSWRKFSQCMAFLAGFAEKMGISWCFWLLYFRRGCNK